MEKNSHELYWYDLNKTKFFGLLTTSALVLRTCFHPLALIKTRLQAQQKFEQTTHELIRKTRLEEGLRGFYRGYSVSIWALLFEPVFMGTLEFTRTFLNNHQPKFISKIQWDTLNSSLSAGTAALVQQTFLVPIDMTTQRLMITRSCDHVRVIDIIRDIYLKSGDGIRGFYKGYFVTLSISLPFNSIIWTLYWKIQSQLERFISPKYDQIISPLSSTLAALLTSFLTQPIDVLKTRLQVSSKRESIVKIAFYLIEQRGVKGFFSGSIPRALIILPSSVITMSLYEIIKRTSAR